MLKINPDPTFTADVEISIPGQEETGSARFTFKYKDRDDLEEFNSRIREASGKDDRALLAEILVGWDIEGAEFNQENLGIFLKNYPTASGEILTRYYSLTIKSRVKN